MVQLETVKELESAKTVLDTIDESTSHRLVDVHTVARSLDTGVLERSSGAADGTNRLSETESIDDNLQGSAGREQSGRGGGIAGRSEGESREETLSAGRDDHSIELDGIRSGVSLINAVGQTLRNDDNINAVLRKLLAELRGCLDGGRGLNRSQEANLQSIELLQLLSESANVSGLVVVVVGRVSLRLLNADSASDAASEVVGHAVQLDDDIVAYDRALDVGVLKTNSIDDELLFGGSK